MKRENWEIEAVTASWEVFEACPRCGSLAGEPCWDIRQSAHARRWHALRNPHPGRKKIKK